MSEVAIQTAVKRLINLPDLKPFTLFNATGKPLPKSFNDILR